MPRAPPKAYQLLIKTHKVTVFVVAHQSFTVTKVKEEALSALTSTVLSSSSSAPHIPTAPGDDAEMMDSDNGDSDIPRVHTTDDFELCRAVKDKGKSTSVSYEMLDPSAPIKGLLNNWEMLYVQFKDDDGILLPVQVSQPSLLDEEDEDARRAPPAPEPPTPVGKGKRKAPPE